MKDEESVFSFQFSVFSFQFSVFSFQSFGKPGLRRQAESRGHKEPGHQPIPALKTEN